MLTRLFALTSFAKTRKRGATFQQDELRRRQYQGSRDGIARLGQTLHQLYDFSYGTVITDVRYDGYYHLGLGPINAFIPQGYQAPVINWGGALGKQKGLVQDQNTGVKYNIHGYQV